MYTLVEAELGSVILSGPETLSANVLHQSRALPVDVGPVHNHSGPSAYKFVAFLGGGKGILGSASATRGASLTTKSIKRLVSLSCSHSGSVCLWVTNILPCH